MFDETIPPANLPTGGKEPDDMFAQVEPAVHPDQGRDQSGKPVVDLPPAPAATPSPFSTPPQPTPTAVAVKSPLIASRKLIIMVGAVVGILAVVGVVLGILRFVRRATAPLPQQSAIPSTGQEATEPTIPTLPASPEFTPEASAPFLPPEEPPISTPSAPEVSAQADSDGDGITNGEEEDRGTNPDNPDSDNDGLFDGEEVFTYQTDPLNPDTDGDTYKDGDEVSNGYNPKGAGKLFTVPSQ